MYSRKTQQFAKFFLKDLKCSTPKQRNSESDLYDIKTVANL